MSRIWDVDGIEWEDLPCVSDLLCAADTKILARELALRYAGKEGGCSRGRGDSERGYGECGGVTERDVLVNGCRRSDKNLSGRNGRKITQMEYVL